MAAIVEAPLRILPWSLALTLLLTSCSGGLPGLSGGSMASPECVERAAALKTRLDTELAVVEQSQWWDYPPATQNEAARDVSLALATSSLPYVRSETFSVLELDGTQVRSAGVLVTEVGHARFEELLTATLVERRDQERAMAKRKGEEAPTSVVALFVYADTPAARTFEVLEVVAKAEIDRVDLVLRQAEPPAVEWAEVPARIAADVAAYEEKRRSNPLGVSPEESPLGLVFADCAVDWAPVGVAAPADKHKVWAETAAAGFELCRCKAVEDEILWYVQQEKIPAGFTTVLPVTTAVDATKPEVEPTRLQVADEAETWQQFADRFAMTHAHLAGQGWPAEMVLSPPAKVTGVHSWTAVR